METQPTLSQEETLYTENPNQKKIKSKTEETLISQNKNLQSQIKILTQKINDYENEYLQKTARLSEQIRKLNSGNATSVKESSKKVQGLQKENVFLKQSINEMEKAISYFKKEVKELYKVQIKNEALTEQLKDVPSNILKEKDMKIAELVNLVKEYSNEIFKLKEENQNLNEEFEKAQTTNKKNAASTMNSTSVVNESNQIIGEITAYVNSETNLISQWIETYLGTHYDKNFEVPKLTTEIGMDYSKNNALVYNFEHLKMSLENARNQINNLLNNEDTTTSEIQSLLTKSELKNTNYKKELAEAKKKIYTLKENEMKLNEIISSNNIKLEKMGNVISSMDSTHNASTAETSNYLNALYQIIHQEINSVLEDQNFKAFHTTLLCHPKSSNNSFKNIQMILNSSLEHFIQFVNEMKYDYLQTKNENVKLLMNEISKTSACTNIDLAENQRIIREKDEVISKLLSENDLLKNQIAITEQNNKVKEKNENENSKKYSLLKEQFDLIKIQSDKNEKDIEMYKQKCQLYEEKNKAYEKEINQYKEQIERLLKIEVENDKLKYDYQRIINENNMLRTLNQSKSSLVE